MSSAAPSSGTPSSGAPASGTPNGEGARPGAHRAATVLTTTRYAQRLAAGPASLDELLDAHGEPHPALNDLASTVDVLGVPGLLARRAEAAQLVEDEGVTYGSPLTGPDGARLRGAPTQWPLDPLPVVIDAEQWRRLEAAIAQRATVLDLVLADLYGPRRLLSSGLVPAEVIFGHSGFLRQADHVRLPGPRQLFLASADLARDGARGWVVVGDRTQAPSGAGYAMENRRIVSRVLPGLYRDTALQRLRVFFHTMRAALQEVAPAGAQAPRVVLLTPGAGSETAYDQSFLSTLLGYPLVTGQDLTVREGRVFMRSLGTLEPVDVVLRRVDAWYADPLELRTDSRLGVPGLLEASRLGSVSVVNTFGAGVLENPGLLPFLPAIAQTLLDQPLQLPSAQTWWCGDPAGRSHVLTHLEQLVIKPIARSLGPTSRFGWELTSRQVETLRHRIEAEPGLWCGQDPVEMSTAPIVTANGLEPRRMLLRTFAVAHGGGYQVLAGGLARVAARPQSSLVTNESGAVAKDVWVLTPHEVAGDLDATGPQNLWALDVARHGASRSGTPTTGAPRPGASNSEMIEPGRVSSALGMSPRVAEDLFWLGRYAERAEDAVRLLRVVDDLAEDWTPLPGTPGAQSLTVLLRALTRVTTTYPGFVGDPAPAAVRNPHAELVSLVVDASRRGTLAYAVRRAVESAQAVREQLSLDTWIVLGSLDRVLDELAGNSAGGEESLLQPSLARVLEGLLALAGLSSESMVRDAGWHFMDAGRRVERALHVLALLRNCLDRENPTQVEAMVLESVLIIGESIITHRRRHQGRAQVGTVLDLLLLDRENPRSVAYQLDRLAESLRYLPLPDRSPGESSARLRRQFAAVTASLRDLDTALLAEPGGDGVRLALIDVLDAAAEGLARFSLDLTEVHFVRAAAPRPIAATPGWDS